MTSTAIRDSVGRDGSCNERTSKQASEREKGKRGPTERRDGARVIKKKNGEGREKRSGAGVKGGRGVGRGGTEKRESDREEAREREREYGERVRACVAPYSPVR